MKTPAISVKNVSKSFRLPHEKVNTLRGAFIRIFKRRSFETFHAIDDISFDVQPGEFFSIVGQNGSGKSTLLRIISNIYQPDAGSVEVNGRVSPFLALGIGFNPELSGRDNVYLNATILGLSKEQLEEKFNDIVRFSGVERFIDQQVKNYSSGMRSRLAFAVAIHVDADILIMDEVLAVGDESFKEKCFEVFKTFIAEGKTIIFVSHALGSVKDLSDRVLVLQDGKSLGIHTPEKGIHIYRQTLKRE